MLPHPLIHLNLARMRYDQLLDAGRRQSQFELDVMRTEAPRREVRLRASARRACALFAGRLAGYARSPKPSAESHFAHREAGGITVDLYWKHSEHDDSFRVEVVNRDEGTTFTLFPATGKEAVEVYRHPFAEAGESTGASAVRSS